MRMTFDSLVYGKINLVKKNANERRALIILLLKRFDEVIIFK